MREKYEAMGNEMIRSLGFENKKVILFWKAFEEERWLACELHYNCFKKGLTKQSTLDIIIIEREREVSIMRFDVDLTCPLCGKGHTVEVSLAGYIEWKRGEFIQNAMPDLTPTEREQLISCLCSKRQAEMFGD